jgi:hypothetical protein
MLIRNTIFTIALTAVLISCGSKPTVVEKVSEPTASTAMKHNHPATARQASEKSQMHEVVAKDILHTERYTYMDVEEGGERFWIAIPKKDVQVGETYYYLGGLLKRNFKSQEYDRVFETIYLVSDVRSEPIFTGNSTVSEALASVGDKGPGEAGARTQDHVHKSENSVSLEELFTNREKYAGKEIEVTGKCVKINKAIMGRNWVHIQDGTGGDEPYDLTITTSADVPLGTVVTMRGTITLNKDFGAGYKYDIIMENAHTH